LAASPAYIDGLKLLARRELSEAQVRQRLARKGHQPDAIDDAVARLREERAIDDDRVAGAMARTAASLKRRGRRRVRLELERAGLHADLAKRAVDEAFGGVDDRGVIDAVIDKRLGGRPSVEDEREFRRLYRHLIGLGFEADLVIAALRKRKDDKGQ
jgi:regulatory protein